MSGAADGVVDLAEEVGLHREGVAIANLGALEMLVLQRAKEPLGHPVGLWTPDSGTDMSQQWVFGTEGVGVDLTAKAGTVIGRSPRGPDNLDSNPVLPTSTNRSRHCVTVWYATRAGELPRPSTSLRQAFRAPPAPARRSAPVATVSAICSPRLTSDQIPTLGPSRNLDAGDRAGLDPVVRILPVDVASALGRLPPRERNILTLRFRLHDGRAHAPCRSLPRSSPSTARAGAHDPCVIVGDMTPAWPLTAARWMPNVGRTFLGLLSWTICGPHVMRAGTHTAVQGCPWGSGVHG